MKTEYEYKYDQEKVNNKGQREGELIHTSYDETVEYKHLYKEGKLIETSQYRFSVEGLRPLIGKYQNGNPFEGYFVYKNESEIPIIDYYENGTFKAQYTCSLLDLLINEGREFNLKFTKTTFINNKPQDGLVHSEDIPIGHAHLVASEYYKDGKITNVDFWIMAIHYAELIKLKFSENGYTIYKESMPNVEDPVIDNKHRSISVEFKNPQSGNVQFEVEKKLITKYDFNYSDITQKIKAVRGLVTYFFLEDNTIVVAQNSNAENNEKLYEQAFGPNPNIISGIFRGMDNQPIPYFSNEGNNDYSLILETDKRLNSIVSLYLGEKGNPVRGFLIEDEQLGKYRYTQFEDSKAIDERKGLDLETMKELILKAQKAQYEKF